MKKIYLSGVNNHRFTIVDDSDFDYLSRFNWHYSDGYAYRSQRINGKVVNTRMHRELLEAKSNEIVDHKNGNKLDNRRRNIRIATHAQNNYNIKKIRAKSGYKGVRRNPRGYKWVTSICKDNKRIHVGNFITKVEAAAAYNMAAMELFGDFSGENKL